MIPRYTDHAANERTFLAWVRTALAIIAFGCFLAKFDLFLRLVAHIPPTHLTGVGPRGPASLLGAALV
ncbi:YidH family protein, partial [Acetobacter oeni]